MRGTRPARFAHLGEQSSYDTEVIRRRWVVVASLPALSCAALLGFDSVDYGNGGDAGTSDASTDSASDAPATTTCALDLQAGVLLDAALTVDDCDHDGVKNDDLGARGNCGVCGHQCLGDCVNYECVPLQVYDEFEGNDLTVQGIQGGRVFFSVIAPLDGGSHPWRLGSVKLDGSDPIDYGREPDLAVGSPGPTHFFLATTSGLKAISLADGSTSVPLAADTRAVSRAGLGAYFVQFIDLGTERVWYLPSADSTPQQVTNLGSFPSSILAEEDAGLYWTLSPQRSQMVWDAGEIDFSPMGGSTVTVRARGLSDPAGVGADADYVYWVDLQEQVVYRLAKAAAEATPELVARLPVAGTPAASTASVVVDAESLFVLVNYSGGSRILKIPRCGGPARVLYTASCCTYGLAQDGKQLYFGATAARLYTIAK
jgi:hypothetical protein